MIDSLADKRAHASSSSDPSAPRTTTAHQPPAPTSIEYLQLLQKLQMYEQKLAHLEPNADTSTSAVRRQTISAPMATPRPIPPPTVPAPTRQPTTPVYTPPSFQSADEETFREFLIQVVATANEMRAKNRQNE